MHARNVSALLWVALRSRSVMGFVFQRCDDIVEPLDVGGCYALRDMAFQVGQMPTNAASQLSTICRKSDEKRAAISHVDFARYQTSLSEAIKDARQCGPLVRKTAVEIGYLCRCGLRK